MAVVLVACIFVALMNADVETVPEEEKALATYVLAGIRDGRESLSSGVFRADITATKWGKEGSRADQTPNPKQTRSVFCAFNFAEGLFRFDSFVEVGGRNIGGRYVRTPEKALWYTPGERVASIAAPNNPHLRWRGGWDVRVLGLADPLCLDAEGTFDRVFRFFAEEQTLVEAKQEGNDQFKLSWVCGDGVMMKRTVWVNGRRGFTPERNEFRIREGDRWSDVKTSMSSSWTEFSSAWVPRSFRYDCSGMRETFVMNLEWESVNRAIEPKYFSQDGLELPNGTLVADTRFPRPIVVETVGPEDRASSQESLPNEQRNWTIFRLLATVGSLLALIGFGLLKLGIRLLHRKSPGAAND